MNKHILALVVACTVSSLSFASQAPAPVAAPAQEEKAIAQAATLKQVAAAPRSPFTIAVVDQETPEQKRTRKEQRTKDAARRSCNRNLFN